MRSCAKSSIPIGSFFPMLHTPHILVCCRNRSCPGIQGGYHILFFGNQSPGNNRNSQFPAHPADNLRHQSRQNFDKIRIFTNRTVSRDMAEHLRINRKNPVYRIQRQLLCPADLLNSRWNNPVCPCILRDKIRRFGFCAQPCHQVHMHNHRLAGLL